MADKKKPNKKKEKSKPIISRLLNNNQNLILFLIFLSFAVRLLFFIPAAVSKVPPMFDEARYYNRAEGFSQVLKSLIKGEPPAEESLDQAYGDAIWVPLHPLLMSIGMLIFGDSVNAARIIILLFSSFTALIVYFLAGKFVSRKAALFAALIYIFYPSFVAYAHYLWPETIYIFFLSLTVLFIIKSTETDHRFRQFLFPALAGLFLGLTALTRSAVMPYIVLLPVWLFFKTKDRLKKFILPAVLLSAFVVSILPWQYALIKKENRFVFLSNTNGYYFYYGNNKWFSDEATNSLKNGISLMPTVKITALVSKSITYYAKNHSTDVVKAGSELSKREILSDIPDFIKRCFYRLRMFASSDVYLTRNIFRCIYPPMPHILALLLWLAIIFSFIILAGLILSGFITAWEKISHIWLMLLLLLFGLAPPLLVVADSRYALPLLALALPAAGVCCENFNLYKKLGLRQITSIILFLLVALNTILIPKVAYPSSYYAGIINPYDRLMGYKTEYIDQITLKPSSDRTRDEIRIKTLNPEYRLSKTGEAAKLWQIRKPKKAFTFDVYSINPDEFLKIGISENSSTEAIISPVTNENWRAWHNSEMQGIRFRWDGSGYPINDPTFIENYVKLTTDIVPALTAESLARGKDNKIALIGLEYKDLSDDLQYLFHGSLSKFESNKNPLDFSGLIDSLQENDYTIITRKVFNTFITDEKGIPAKCAGLAYIILKPAIQISDNPVIKPAAVILFSKTSDLYNTLSIPDIEMREIKPLTERIKWDRKSDYEFLQSIHIFLFGIRMDNKSAMDMAGKIGQGKLTRKEAYNAIVKNALTLYY